MRLFREKDRKGNPVQRIPPSCVIRFHYCVHNVAVGVEEDYKSKLNGSRFFYSLVNVTCNHCYKPH